MRRRTAGDDVVGFMCGPKHISGAQGVFNAAGRKVASTSGVAVKVSRQAPAAIARRSPVRQWG